MEAIANLAAQVERSLERMADGERGVALCQVAEVMAQHRVPLAEEDKRQFDAIFVRFCEVIETVALAKIAFTLSHMENGPPQFISRLAGHADIVVAGPVLADSPMLSDAQLVEIAAAAGQGHLRAMCARTSLAEDVSAAILARGDPETTRLLVGNDGARFSEASYDELIARSRDNDGLASQVGGRKDIPSHIFEKLVNFASADVRERLLRANPKIAAVISRAVDEAADGVRRDAYEIAETLAQAHHEVAELHRRGELDSARVCDFAARRQGDQTLAALAVLCRISLEAAHRAYTQAPIDTIVMMSKIADLDWTGARGALMAIKRGVATADVDRAMSQFARLRPVVARQILQLRTRAGGRPAAARARPKVPGRG